MISINYRAPAGHGEKTFTCTRDNLRAIISRAHVIALRACVITSRVHAISPFRPIHAQSRPSHVCVQIHIVEHSQRNTSVVQPWTNYVKINKLVQNGRIFQKLLFKNNFEGV